MAAVRDATSLVARWARAAAVGHRFVVGADVFANSQLDPRALDPAPTEFFPSEFFPPWCDRLMTRPAPRRLPWLAW